MTTTTRTSRRGLDGGLRATTKVLPEHARAHNRSLVLQHLFHEGPTSRAGLARATGLTRVTISDLVSVLLAEGLVEELGTQPGRRVGKPAILVGMRTDAYQIVAIDLSDDAVLRGAVLTLTGEAVERQSLGADDYRGDDLVELIARFARKLVAAATRPVIGIGVGSPGVVDPSGRVVEAPNVEWVDVPLAATLSDRIGLPVHVANDANSAALAEYTYGGATGSTLVLTIGKGVGAGIMVDGARVHGAGYSAGELGHVTAVDDHGEPCACGRRGCLETVLSAPALRRALDGLEGPEADAALTGVGVTLGKALAPVVGALNLGEIVLAGPPELLGEPLRRAALETITDRTMPASAAGLGLRMSTLDDDVVLAGAAVLVLGAQLGVS
ncbi:ROK family transcriptional regulator [Isoptericola chiayiensis]|uniref:ROK family transcriptional regulator n=1 Tax=Isoptericola chiayiensis TaxID=579446 RepID=A0ABP8XYE8_9MICO|nr:ROK family transcriptional regulator [Isoptericola chiayiensis]NOW01109.1 putative NBD/HSP70 family sugar kinase [Isoptericola chiayiensis]